MVVVVAAIVVVVLVMAVVIVQYHYCCYRTVSIINCHIKEAPIALCSQQKGTLFLRPRLHCGGWGRGDRGRRRRCSFTAEGESVSDARGPPSPLPAHLPPPNDTDFKSETKNTDLCPHTVRDMIFLSI